MSKYIIEINDETEDGLPFAEGPVHRCPALDMCFDDSDLEKLTPYVENDPEWEKMTQPTATRESILEDAKKIVASKPEEYGEPEDCFEAIAEMWSAYLRASFKNNMEIAAIDVALMMVLLKVARAVGSMKIDNYVDIAGYAACAGEMEANI